MDLTKLNYLGDAKRSYEKKAVLILKNSAAILNIIVMLIS
jgi:hypothetical protein